MAKTPSKPTAEVKPAPAPTPAPARPAQYADTLRALDQIEAQLKVIVPDLIRHAGETSDLSHIAALLRARAICGEFLHCYDSIRRPRHDPLSRPLVAWCGEPLLPVALSQ